MDAQKQIIERLKQANNVLLTVSSNPTVDQLAALIGLSLLLSKYDKHATAVYSGVTPSTIEFLQPEGTIEKTTDSLRDFIISLDKSKADKLRYKVEDSVVRIFITPYRTSITDADLDFSQGDFNIDVILALGVHQQQDLDQAITAHGRILHDAPVMTINNNMVAELGSINWLNESASSISEMVTVIAVALGKDLLDEQIATALLTGIVAETDRFSNEKTSANTMKASAVLMGAGANQQLVATKLQEAVEAEMSVDEESQPDEGDENAEDTNSDEPEPPKQDDGTLQISHDDEEEQPKDDSSEWHEDETPGEDNDASSDEQENQENQEAQEEYPEISHVKLNAETAAEVADGDQAEHLEGRHSLKDEPTFPVPESAAKEGDNEEFIEEMTLPAVPEEGEAPMLTHEKHMLDGDHHAHGTHSAPDHLEKVEQELAGPTIIRPTGQPDTTLVEPTATLDQIEHEVNSPHLHDKELEELDLSKLERPDGLPSDGLADVQAPDQSLEEARNAVQQATLGVPEPPKPAAALNAQPLGDRLHETPLPPLPSTPPVTAPFPVQQPAQNGFTLPPIPPVPPAENQQPNQANAGAPAPSVPPPILPFPGQ